MNCIAIDPGTTKSALVVWNGECVLEKLYGPNEDVLKWLENVKGQDLLAIEMIASYGMAVGQEVFETCVWIGRFMQAYGPELTTLITRITVKTHLCHSVKAKDQNIRQVIIDRYGPPGTTKNPGRTFGIANDLWSALAVGITFHDQHNPTFGKLAKSSPRDLPPEGLFQPGDDLWPEELSSPKIT